MENKNENAKKIKQTETVYWDAIHESFDKDEIIYDGWLQRFSKEINECDTPIIDLGCGRGNDTKYLIELGKEVIPCDYSSIAIESIKKNFPGIKLSKCFDMKEGLPFDDEYTNIIIADLSLHYFSEKETRKILDEIKRVLRKEGILLFRVNSLKDINYGVGQGIEIERHYYKTSDGIFKRFFDKKDIELFFDAWEIFFINEEQMTRYEKPKIVWTVACKVKK